MQTHTNNKYKDLAWLVGIPLQYVSGLSLYCDPDGEVKIIEDYPNTVLLQLEYIASEWGEPSVPRYLLFMIPKAALATGAVQLRIMSTRQPLTGDMITDRVWDDECIIDWRITEV